MFQSDYLNKNGGHWTDPIRDESQSDDNGYDEEGNQVNNKGGDRTDFLYGKDGKIKSSTSVQHRNISQGEFAKNGGKLNGYGFRGRKMAKGNSESMEFSSPFFGWTWAFKGMGAIWQSTFGTTAELSGTALARVLGQAGEEAVGITGSKTAIQVAGRTRIPDRLTATTLEEVKNVKNLSFTRQLRDFYLYSQENNLQMILYTRSNTTLSGPLNTAIQNGQIIQRFIPGN